MPKIVGNGVDLSKLQLRINYQNASKIPSGKDMYIVTDATVYNDEWVYFSWELSRKVTQYKGSIYFIVCAVKADSNGNITNEWNTTLAEGKVLEGLEVETNQEQQYQASDYLEQLKQQLLDYSKEIKDTFPSDYTETVENVKNLQNDVQKLDNNKITKFYTNNLGDMTLNDSDNGKISDMLIYGKSEQKSYTGKNLVQKVIYGYINSDGNAINIDNDSTSVIAYLEEGKTYKISCSVSLDRLKIGQVETTNIVNLTPVTNVYEGNTNTYVFVANFTGYACVYVKASKNTSVIKSIQIEEGDTATEYEPYVGGIPSPNPEYPQEIKSVVNPAVKVYGKNLLDVSKAEFKVGKAKLFNGEIYLNGTFDSKFDYYFFDARNVALDLVLKVNKTVTISCGSFNVGIWKGSGSTCGKSIKINPVYDKLISIFVSIPSGTYENVKVPIMVEIGDTVTDYEPYIEPQTPILPYTLNAIPVSSGGNVTIDGQQYIADYVDIERGKLVRRTCVIKFTGAESWSYTDPDKEQSRRFGLSINVKGVQYLGLSNYLRNADRFVKNSENAFVFLRHGLMLE